MANDSYNIEDYTTLGDQTPILVDTRMSFTIAASLSVSADLTYTIQWRLENDPTSIWHDFCLKDQTTDSHTFAPGPLRQIRANITSYTSGTLTLEIRGAKLHK